MSRRKNSRPKPTKAMEQTQNRGYGIHRKQERINVQSMENLLYKSQRIMPNRITKPNDTQTSI